MFYDKEIRKVEIGPGIKDEYGIFREGEKTLGEKFLADVQPITKELAFKVFGVTEKVKYRLFSSVPVKNGDLLKYGDELLRVINVLDWDTFVDFIVGDYDE